MPTHLPLFVWLTSIANWTDGNVVVVRASIGVFLHFFLELGYFQVDLAWPESQRRCYAGFPCGMVRCGVQYFCNTVLDAQQFQCIITANCMRVPSGKERCADDYVYLIYSVRNVKAYFVTHFGYGGCVSVSSLLLPRWP